uniref:hypothetical protein n=1 Tax=Thiolapillus sp. TaxID=2017437 RepID=UPI003AF9FDDB
FDFLLCASFLFTLATTPKNSAKHPKIHKNDPNTKRLAPTGNFLNVTITVKKSTYLLTFSKVDINETSKQNAGIY